MISVIDVVCVFVFGFDQKPDVYGELLKEVLRVAKANPIVAYQLGPLFDDTQASLSWSNPQKELFMPPLTGNAF